MTTIQEFVQAKDDFYDRLLRLETLGARNPQWRDLQRLAERNASKAQRRYERARRAICGRVTIADRMVNAIQAWRA